MGRKRKSEKSDLYGHGLIVGLAIPLVALFGVVLYKAFHAEPSNRGQADITAIPTYYARVEDALPLPATVEPAVFKRAEVREAYQTAKEIPSVLVQQPCYCYCQRKGHRGLLDCFKTDHAASCDICVKEALLAGRMHRQGKSTEEIRTTIIEGKWANLGHSNQ
jgi:hypothetical protein